MVPLRTKIEFLDVFGAMVDLTGERVSVFVSFPEDAGGASFTAELFAVTPSLANGPALLVQFVDEFAVVDLDEEKMTAYRVVSHGGETWWLDFDVDSRRVLSIQPTAIDEEGLA